MHSELPRLAGEAVVLRPATPDDVPDLVRVLTDPEVSRWWGPTGEQDVCEMLDDDEVTIFAVLVEGEVAGLVQFHEETEPDYRHAGIDISIASPWHGRGLGTDAVRTLARYLIEQRRHHRLTIDPAAANTRAIACYRKVGFREVGVMRLYERAADGTWHDGLLMDLLAEELRR